MEEEPRGRELSDSQDKYRGRGGGSGRARYGTKGGGIQGEEQ